MAGPGGLQPLTGFVDTTPELTAEEQQGGPADPRHGHPLVAEQAHYPGQVMSGVLSPGRVVPDPGLFGSVDLADAAGDGREDPRFDATPHSHAAPWPKGVEQSTDPDAVARQLEQSAAIHASNTGASRRIGTRISAQQDEWVDFYTVDAGTSLQDPGVPGQLKGASGGYGTTDRVSSFARQNAYGYDSVHFHRRYATGSVPGAYMWMQPGGRPMVKSQAGPARPAVGEASPFTGQDLTLNFGTQGAVLQTAPSEYVTPPEPYIAPTPGPGPEPGPVSWW